MVEGEVLVQMLLNAPQKQNAQVFRLNGFLVFF